VVRFLSLPLIPCLSLFTDEGGTLRQHSEVAGLVKHTLVSFLPHPAQGVTFIAEE